MQIENHFMPIGNVKESFEGVLDSTALATAYNFDSF
jgi:hypothetical protein